MVLLDLGTHRADVTGAAGPGCGRLAGRGGLLPEIGVRIGLKFFETVVAAEVIRNTLMLVLSLGI
jgi:hypothetical protein